MSGYRGDLSALQDACQGRPEADRGLLEVVAVVGVGLGVDRRWLLMLRGVGDGEHC